MINEVSGGVLEEKIDDEQLNNDIQILSKNLKQQNISLWIEYNITFHVFMLKALIKIILFRQFILITQQSL